MTKKRFVDGGAEAIEEQFLIDTLTNKNYWIDNGLDEIIDMLNQLSNENEELKQSHKEILNDLEVVTFDKELLQKENEQLNDRVKDLEELNQIYVDFLVCEDYELSDVMKGDDGNE